jgi:hypothetical protein
LDSQIKAAAGVPPSIPPPFGGAFMSTTTNGKTAAYAFKVQIKKNKAILTLLLKTGFKLVWVSI